MTFGEGKAAWLVGCGWGGGDDDAARLAAAVTTAFRWLLTRRPYSWFEASLAVRDGAC